jgi:hypothetical protein
VINALGWLDPENGLCWGVCCLQDLRSISQTIGFVVIVSTLVQLLGLRHFLGFSPEALAIFIKMSYSLWTRNKQNSIESNGENKVH